MLLPMRRLALILALAPLPLLADPPEVVDAWVEGQTVYVTLRHPDTGWEHYADGWDVETADGTRIGMRVLFHPHVNEQPFTRSLRLDAPPPDAPLFVRARCLVDGWNEATTPLRRK